MRTVYSASNIALVKHDKGKSETDQFRVCNCYTLGSRITPYLPYAGPLLTDQIKS